MRCRCLQALNAPHTCSRKDRNTYPSLLAGDMPLRLDFQASSKVHCGVDSLVSFTERIFSLRFERHMGHLFPSD